MNFTKCLHGALLCLLSAPLPHTSRAQQTPAEPSEPQETSISDLNADIAPAVNVNPGCNGVLFNLESRTSPVPQNTESVDFLPNRIAPGVDLVVAAANDERAAIGGFDAYYVSRQPSTCGVDFEGTLSTAAIDPTVVADPPRDAFFLADLFLSSPEVEVARTTATNLLSATACPNGTQLNGNNPACWPVVGTANFSNPNISQSALRDPHIAVDLRTTGTGAGDVYVVAQFENVGKFPAVSSVQIVACVNATLRCGAPAVVSGSDTFGSFPYVQVRADGVITVSYWTFTKPFGTQPNPIDIKFATCTPQGAPKAPICSTPVLVATSSVPGLFAPGDSGFRVSVFPKHADRTEGNGAFTTFLVYDHCAAIVGSPTLAAPACAKAGAELTFSTDGGATWSTPEAIESGPGHQFFTAIRNDTSTQTVNIAYYSTQGDFLLQRAKLRLRQIAPGTTVVSAASILTSSATDPDAGIQNLIEPGGQGVIDFGDRFGLAAAGTGRAGQSRVYLHYTWNNVFGIFNGTSQPDQNNTLLSVTY